MTHTQIIAEAKANIEEIGLELVETRHGSERAKELNILMFKYQKVVENTEFDILNFLDSL